MLGLGVTVIGIGILYGQILKIESRSYLPFISISLAVWYFISSTLTESTVIFQSHSHVITSTPVPYTTFVLRCVTRNTIVAAHYVVVVAVTFALCRYPVHWIGLAAIPGVVLVCANLLWISLLIGLICARFRDVAQMIMYLIQLAMFLTPIIWQPSQIHSGAIVLALNPFYHLVEVVRGPLLDGVFPVQSFVFCAVAMVIGSIVSALALIKFRRSLVFWI
jgi:lipopolysaccharide transport system permease protein